MGVPVLILGESGSGKSASMRNFKSGEIGILNVAGKPLPFKTDLKAANINKISKTKGYSRYNAVKSIINAKSKEIKSFVIDDSQYLLAFDSFDHALEIGFTKFTNYAINFKDLIDFIVNDTPDDCIVYFLHHVETTDDGKIKAKTIGKMLDQQITVEGLFTIVLLCRVEKQRHYFVTQSDGTSTAKSPMDMFDYEIDNDLKAVDNAIRDYYSLK